jgi:hypothetical protein
MRIKASVLLRDFPGVRQAVLAGEEVLIETPEGTLRLTREETTSASSAWGILRGELVEASEALDEPTTRWEEWEPERRT